MRKSMGTSLFQRPRIECADGASMSVQAAEFAYCIPRNNVGPYTHVEVGYPSHPFPEAAYYKDDAEVSDTETIFPNVPVEIVVAWINKHGGPVSGPWARAPLNETPPKFKDIR